MAHPVSSKACAFYGWGGDSIGSVAPTASRGDSMHTLVHRIRRTSLSGYLPTSSQKRSHTARGVTLRQCFSISTSLKSRAGEVVECVLLRAGPLIGCSMHTRTHTHVPMRVEDEEGVQHRACAACRLLSAAPESGGLLANEWLVSGCM